MSFNEKDAPNVNTDIEAALKSLIKERIVIMDGAMGTMLQQEKLDEKDFAGQKCTDIPASIREIIENAKASGIELKGNNELLSITRPDIIKAVHQKFLSVGADIIETNTFSSTSVAMADYHMENLIYELNFESAKIAVNACKKYTDLNLIAGNVATAHGTEALIDAGELEYPSHFQAANFVDTFDLGKTNSVDSVLLARPYIFRQPPDGNTRSAGGTLRYQPLPACGQIGHKLRTSQNF